LVLSVPENTAKVKGYLFGALAAFGAAAWFQPDVAGSDLWWHLAAGRAMWADAAIPCCDHFSFTFEGRPWMNHEWLWDLVIWPIFSLDSTALWVAHLAVLLAVFGLAARRCRARTLGWAAPCLTLWLVASTAHWFLDIRPHLWTLLLIQLFLLAVERDASPWTWPPLIAVWVNVHAGFAFALGAIGLHCAIQSARDRLGGRPLRDSRRLWCGLGACLLAAGLNPWGFHIFVYPLSYLPGLEENPYRQLVEWLPPGSGLAGIDVRGAWIIQTFQFRFWLLVALTGCALPLRAARAQPLLPALCGVTLCMAVASRRFIPLFAITAAPLVALSIEHGILRLGKRIQWSSRSEWSPRLRLAGALSLAGIAVASWIPTRLFPDPLGRMTQRDLYPAAAVLALRELPGRPRVLNHYSWGGFILLHAPAAQVFIDGRANTLYDAEHLHDFQHLMAADADFEQLLARHRIEYALVPDGRLTRALLSLPSPWSIVHQDAVASLLAAPGMPTRLRRDTEGPPVSTELVRAAESQQLTAQARRSARQGALARAIEELEAAIAADPIASGPYLDLARVHALRGDASGVARTLARAERAGPRRHRVLQRFAGELLLRLGYPAAARQAFVRGLSTGPFDDLEPQLERIRMLPVAEPRGKPAPAS